MQMVRRISASLMVFAVGLAIQTLLGLDMVKAAEPNWQEFRYSTADPNSPEGRMLFRLSDDLNRWPGTLTIEKRRAMTVRGCSTVTVRNLAHSSQTYQKKEHERPLTEREYDEIWKGDLKLFTSEYCLISDEFAFSYPLNGKDKRLRYSTDWDDFGLGVASEENITIEAFGNRIEGLMRIEVSPDSTPHGRLSDEAWEILYSPKTGIIAFTKKDGLTGAYLSDTYWLEGEVGIGALDLPPPAEGPSEKDKTDKN